MRTAAPEQVCTQPEHGCTQPERGCAQLWSGFTGNWPFFTRKQRKSVLLAAIGLLFLVLALPAFSQTKTILLSNGPSTNRLNLTVLSEGYQSSEEAKFVQDAAQVIDSFLASEPYHEYRSFFNASAIFVASVDSGSDHPAYPTTNNTYFNSSYDLQNDNFITIPLDGNGLGKVDALLQTLAPETDLKILIVNDMVYGGAGGPILITSMNVAAPEIVVHESGHTLAGLGDEYTNSVLDSVDTEEPNTTRETKRDLIKWKAWIKPTTPIPTPPDVPDYENEVGLFQGAHYHSAGWYRPKLNCKMRQLGYPFCEVCTEALVKGIYKRVHLIESFSPATQNFSLTTTQAVNFQISTVQPATHNLAVQWFANGIPISGATNVNFQLTTLPLAKGTYSVRAAIRDPTPWVRNDPENSLSNSVTWKVTKSFAPPALYDSVKGKYSGLFFETNEVRLAGSGFFNLNLAGSGAFSGKILMPDATSGFKGSFISNHADVFISRRNQTPLQINLDLDPLQFQMRGQISGFNWIADLKANRDSTNGATTKYTFLIPGQDATNSPAGDSFGSAVLRTEGFLQMSGTLSDGTRFHFKNRGSSAGEFPFFIRLYSGKGMLLSWLHFTNGIVGEDSVNWIKGAGARGKYYPAGFTNVSLFEGDRYDAPLPRTPALDWTNATLILEGGNLIAASTNDAVLTNNTFVFTGTNKVSLAIAPATGLLKGKFLHPLTQKITAMQGAILQQRRLGGGFFLGTNESGRMNLQEVSEP